MNLQGLEPRDDIYIYEALSMLFSPYSFVSFLSDPSILLGALFSDIHNLWSPFAVRVCSTLTVT
jgi:hypothetical protein